MNIDAYIDAAESDLRDLAQFLLSDGRPAELWLAERGLSSGRLATLTERRVIEVKKRPGVVTDENLLLFADFYDLRTLVEKNWPSFKDVLGSSKAGVLFYLERLESLRNARAHGRSLLPFEEALVVGISGEIRNVVTIFRSTMNEASMYFPRIERVRDSFGNLVDGERGLSAETGLVLRVGDSLTFTCSAWAPSGQRLTWTLHPSMIGDVIDTSVGTDVEISLELKPEHVGRRVFQLRLTSDSQYHLHGTVDGFASFTYTILPA